MEQVGYAIVGDGKFGFKFFGETFDNESSIQYWENRGYRVIPVFVEMTEELKEFYFY
jgi:hypothetical protein